MNCPICKERILKDQKIAVVSYPVICNGDDGDYSFLGDFSKNEKLYHLRCFKQQWNSIDIFETSTKNNTKNNTSGKYKSAKDFYTALVELGEKPNLPDVIAFMNKNQEIPDLGQLIGEWFKNRKEFV